MFSRETGPPAAGIVSQSRTIAGAGSISTVREASAGTGVQHDARVGAGRGATGSGVSASVEGSSTGQQQPQHRGRAGRCNGSIAAGVAEEEANSAATRQHHPGGRMVIPHTTSNSTREKVRLIQ